MDNRFVACTGINSDWVAYLCPRPRLCENAKSENPSGKLPPIYYILRLENGLQWFVQLLTRPVMQRYPTCEKFKIIFTQLRPQAEIKHLLI
jgi:hypothetical protein